MVNRTMTFTAPLRPDGLTNAPGKVPPVVQTINRDGRLAKH